MEWELAGSMKVVNIIGYIAAINFVLFFLLSIIIGGDALNGFIQNGEYFVVDYGRHTQVSH